jgi:hypothetical protein
MASPSTRPRASRVWDSSRIVAIREAPVSSPSRRQVSRVVGSATGWVSSPMDGCSPVTPNSTNPSSQGTSMKSPTHDSRPKPLATMVASIQLTRSLPAVRVRTSSTRLRPIIGQPAR